MKKILIATWILLSVGLSDCFSQSLINISGLTTVCKGEEQQYSFNPTTGLNYSWTINNGALVFTGSNFARVMWVQNQGTLTLIGKDTSGTVIESGQVNVTVFDNPEPYITTNVKVGCVPLAYDTVEAPDESDSTECIKVCNGTNVVFNANGASSSTYDWTVTGGSIVNTSGTSATISFNQVGSASVRVVETNTAGCTNEDLTCVEVLEGPEADFRALPFNSGDQILGCTDNEIEFKDLSIATGGSPIVSWRWDFGDGSFSNLQNPVHIYADPGVYDVSLSIENACHCTSVFTAEVLIEQGLDFEVVCPSVVCEGQLANYSINHQSCTDFDWEIEGGTFVSNNIATNEVDILWDDVDDDGFGYIHVYDRYCQAACDGAKTIKIPVIKSEAVIDGPTEVCEGETVRLSVPKWPSVFYNWEVDGNATIHQSDQPNEIVVFGTGGGSATIRLSYHSNMVSCGGKSKHEVSVYPEEFISGKKTVCEGENVQYTLSNSASGTWTLEEPNGDTQTGTGNTFTGTFNVEGRHYLTVSGNDFCVEKPYEIEAIGEPVAPSLITGPDAVCENIPYTLSAAGAEPATTLNWSVQGGGVFADGTTTTSGNQVSATFSGTGPYEVKVWKEARSGLKCSSDTITKIIARQNINLAINGNDSVCDNSFEMYDAGYLQGDVYEWSVLPQTAGSVTSGNGDANVEILWNGANTAFNAQVVVKAKTCGSDYFDTLAVHVTPSSSISIAAPDTLCQQELGNFSIVDGMGTPISSFSSIEWDFGNGITSTEYSSATKNYAYTSGGSNVISYVINAVVTNPGNCNTQLNLQQTIFIKPTPVAYASPTQIYGCDSTDIVDTLYANIQSGIGSTFSFQWFKNGAAIGGGTSAILPVIDTGNYYCVVVGDNGCPDTTNLVPVGYASCEGSGSSPDCPDTINIIANATHLGCGEIQLSASYPANNFYQIIYEEVGSEAVTYTSSPPTFTFDKAGTFTFKATAFYILGSDTCSYSDTVNAIVPYAADLRYTITCGSGGTYDVNIYDHSAYHPTATISNYKFTVNGVVVSNSTIDNVFQQLGPGSHPIELEISGGGNAACTVRDTIVLPDLPVADFNFSFNGACINYPIRFTNLSTPGGGLNYFWDFNDGAFSTVSDPSRVFAIAGSEDVKLVVRNKYGCEDSITKAVDISPNGLFANLTASPDPSCEGTPIVIDATPAGLTSPSYFVWQPDSMRLTGGNLSNIEVFESGYYFTTLHDQNNCFYNTNQEIVEVVPMPEADILGPDGICDGDSLKLNGDVGAGNFGYQWQVNGSVVSTNEELKLPTGPGTSLPAGNHTIVLTVSRSAPIVCSSIDTLIVTVFPKPAAPSLSYAVVSCTPYEIEISASNIIPGTFLWSDGQEGSGIQVEKGGQYEVYFIDTNGCTSSETIYIPRSPSKFIWIYPKGCYEFCQEEANSIEFIELADPIIPFAAWDMINSNPPLNGSNEVPDAKVQAPFTGTYDFELNTPDCDATKGSLDLELLLTDCECDVRADFISSSYRTSSGGCQNLIELYLGNPYSFDLPLNVYSQSGIFIPSVQNVPAGSSNIYTFQFIPFSGVAPGSTITAWVTTYVKGKKCLVEVEIQLPTPLCDAASFFKRGTNAANSDSSNEEKAVENLVEFSMVPNPAKSEVLFTYKSLLENPELGIIIYDVQGRVVHNVKFHQAGFEHTLAVDNLTEGMYMVLFKENGKVIEYEKLVIRR